MKNPFNSYRISLTLALTAALMILFSSGCKKNDTSNNPTAPGTGSNANEVVMQNSAFSPSSLTVTAGTTVTWTNKDSYNHTVTSGSPNAPDGKFDSGVIGSNKTYSFRFDTKGTYSYYCKIHPEIMVGTIVVQ